MIDFTLNLQGVSYFPILKLCRIGITIKFKHKVERITFLLYKNLI